MTPSFCKNYDFKLKQSWLICLALCFLLTACASAPSFFTLHGKEEFVRRGRFALTVTKALNEQHALQGAFAWFDNRHQYRLDLSDPLGTIQARIEGGKEGAILTQANGARLWALDPDALIKSALGSPMPVAKIRDWLQGRVNFNSISPSDLEYDAQARPIYFVQDGWQVNLSRYDKRGPKLLVLKRTQPSDVILLRLVIHSD